MDKKKIMQGYQILEETESGITAINESTGEVETLIPTYIPDGSRIITPRRTGKNLQQQRSAKRKNTDKVSEKQSKKTARRLFLCACR